MSELEAASRTRDRSAAGTRLGWIDLTRGAAIICVVYFHATLFLSGVGVDQTLGRAKGVFELFPLPAFFLIAGILGSRSVLTGSFADLARRRLIPLLYVYVLWSLLRFAMFALFPALPSRDTDIPGGDPLSLVLLPILPASIYWFLYALILFFVVAWLVRRAPKVVVISAAAIVSALFSSGLVNTGTIVWNRFGALLVFFIVGIFLARSITDAVERSRTWHTVAAVAAYALIAIGLAFFRVLTAVPGTVLLAQCAAVTAAVLVARRLARLPALGFVSACGRASLPIYVVHLFVIAPAAFLIGLLEPDWSAPTNIAVALGVAALAVLAGFGLVRVSAFAPWLLAPVWKAPARKMGTPQ